MYKDYINVYINRKFKELKLNSITFLVKMYLKLTEGSSPKNVEIFGSFKKAPSLTILK